MRNVRSDGDDESKESTKKRKRKKKSRKETKFPSLKFLLQRVLKHYIMGYNYRVT